MAPAEAVVMVAASAVTTAVVEGTSERTRAPLVDAQAAAASAATQAAVVGASVRIQAPLAGARAAVAMAVVRVGHWEALMGKGLLAATEVATVATAGPMVEQGAVLMAVGCRVALEEHSEALKEAG